MALTLGDNFSYQGAKPLDARLIYSTVASMKAVADSTMYDGCMAYCTATSKTYQWKSTNDVDETTGKWREFTSGGDTIQVDTLPTAGADELGNVYQYIGSTTSTLTHGYFYECVSDGESTPTYSWSQVEVSKGGHDIKNNGVAVTSRDTMNFTDFDIADDSTNEETDVKAHRLTQAEMSEIMSTLPGTPTELPVMFDLTGAESVVGWYKLSNGTKKPVYKKSFFVDKTTIASIPSDYTPYNVVTSLTNIDRVVSLESYMIQYNPDLECVYTCGHFYESDERKMKTWFRQGNAIGFSWAGWPTDARQYELQITIQYTKTTDVAS